MGDVYSVRGGGYPSRPSGPAFFVPLNTADDWLHFALGTGMVALGLLLSRSGATRDHRSDRSAALR